MLELINFRKVSIKQHKQTNKFAEVAGLVAGALLAPSFLNGALDGKKTPVIGKPKPKKRKS